MTSWISGRSACRRTRSTAASSSPSDSESGAWTTGVERRGNVGARKPVAPVLAQPFEDVHHFAHLLVLEQAAHEFGARILPRLLAVGARQQHLRLDAQQARGHLEVLGRLVQLEVVHARDELLAMRATGMS